jgi:hypothetical protein
MFQDSAGTTPVTAVGQPVGRILDKSGNNNHATQATTASRPVLQQDGDGKYYLGFDGVDDLLKTPAFLTNGGSHAVTVSAGLLRSSTGNGVVIQSSNDELCNNGWGVQAGLYDGNQWGARLGVGADLFVAVANIVTTAKQTISIQFDTDGATYNDDLIYKINNIRQTLAGSLNNPSGALPEYQLYIGSFDSLFSAAMRMYASVILFRKMTTQEAIDTEAWVNGKTGAY